LFNALLNLLLVPLIGINGSAIATAAVFILEGFIVVVMSKRLFRIVL